MTYSVAGRFELGVMLWRINHDGKDDIDAMRDYYEEKGMKVSEGSESSSASEYGG